MGSASSGSNDKTFMNEGWSSNSGNSENRSIKVLDDPTIPDLGSEDFGGFRW